MARPALRPIVWVSDADRCADDLHRIGLQCNRARACRRRTSPEVKRTPVKRTNNFIASDLAIRQRPQAVGAIIIHDEIRALKTKNGERADGFDLHAVTVRTRDFGSATNFDHIHINYAIRCPNYPVIPET